MIIQAENLQKTYPNGTPALKGINLTVNAGEMIGILGRSGAGKTSFLRLLNGAIRPTGGKLEVLGQPMQGVVTPHQLRLLRRQVGVVYQQHNLIGALSALQNVLIGRLGRENFWHSLSRYFYLSTVRQQEALECLFQVGLLHKAAVRADDLSGGQQQRVALARVLLQQPRLLLADEPIASVDVQTAEIILEILAKLNHEMGTAVILNLHQVDFAIRYCRRILVFENGLLKYDGLPENLNQNNIYNDSLVS